MFCVEFHVRSLSTPERIGILPGSFNPPTLAHRALVYAAGFHVDEVLCVIPRAFPHKEYFGATLEERLDLLANSDLIPPYSIAISREGLFIDIARECREHYRRTAKMSFICGADAAERILHWNYGRPGVVEEMLEEFELLVAPRSGRSFAPPAQYKNRVHALHLRDDFHHVSSTEVRERIKRGQAWEHLVPEEIVEKVRAIYS
jgi:nicotinate (nicotinamide) nucleotide adenylyltransferase